ncbi:MAG TPA: HAMP domain-containing sensor histidine kinase [Candidatus Saccharimonadales bacterium]|nr:HAMP domain-containing sensor histidine kinase [Candidatus Saccharimonadales bacterium]
MGLVHDVQTARKPVTKHISHHDKFYRCYFHPIIANASEPGAQGEVRGAVVIIEDTTEQKVLERSRDEFFSIASHELRTPLTALRGNASMMLEMYKDELESKPDLAAITADMHEAAGRLISIVNDFLDMSSLEQGHTSFSAAHIDLLPIAHKVARDFEASATAKNITITVDDPGAPVYAWADPSHTRQIFMKLISNAVLFTKEGTITVQFEHEAAHITVLVTDAGRGIAENKRHLLFRKLQQASDDILTRDSTHSTGLGLYISSLLAQGMHGKLYLKDSVEGKGSTFALELPAEKQ